MRLRWAQGRGLKSDIYKKFWNQDLGVAFIPFEKLNNQVDIIIMTIFIKCSIFQVNFEELENGGEIMGEILPEWGKEKVDHKEINQEQPVTPERYPAFLRPYFDPTLP